MATKTLALEEIGELVQKASANFDAQVKENEKIATQLKAQTTLFEGLKADLEKIKECGDGDEIKKLREDMEEALNEMADIEAKFRNPAGAITDEQQKTALKSIAVKAVGAFVKTKSQSTNFFEFVKSHATEQCKTLNITTPADGGLAVAETLDRDVMTYARDFSPILSQVGYKASMTRNYRQLLINTYPGVAQGIENVAGTKPAETSTQTYIEVKSKEFKLYAEPRITNEALYGTDIDVYGDLIVLLGEQIAIYLAAQILYGDGQDKNARGILSSNRVDITDETGKSWLPTLTPTGADARPADYYPAVATGVSGSLGTSDKLIVDWVIKTMAKLPSRYRKNAKWHMNENTKTLFELVRNADDNPIFRPDYISGEGFKLNGKEVVIDDTYPDLVADSTFAIYGDLAAAFAYNNGDIDQMLLDPYTSKGSLIVYTEKEFFEMMQRSDAILVCAATANGPVKPA
jgi:HK97 family phage major capsid protein